MCTPSSSAYLNAIYEEISSPFIAMEAARRRFVEAAHERFPLPVAVVAEKVSMATLDTLSALASLAGGVLTIPALLLTYGRKTISMLPLIRDFFRDESSSLHDFRDKVLNFLGKAFEETAVPAFFVAMTVDAVYSLAVGWFMADLGALLHSTIIAIPGAVLAYQHMCAHADFGYIHLSVGESP